MENWLLWGYVWQRTMRLSLGWRLARTERGEGVISTAIAVLVMAALGVAMWTLFRGTLDKTNTNVDTEIGKISG